MSPPLMSPKAKKKIVFGTNISGHRDKDDDDEEEEEEEDVSTPQTTPMPLRDTKSPATASVPPRYIDDPYERQRRDEVERGIQRERMLKEGYLIKCGKKNRMWNQRWCVLRPQALCIYKQRKEYPLKAIIHLENIKAVGHDKDQKRPYVFGILTDLKVFFFDAQDEETMEAWIGEIKQARDTLLGNVYEESFEDVRDGSTSPVSIPLPDIKKSSISLPPLVEGSHSPSDAIPSLKVNLDPNMLSRHGEYNLPLVASPRQTQKPPSQVIRFDSASPSGGNDLWGSPRSGHPALMQRKAPGTAKAEDLKPLIIPQRDNGAGGMVASKVVVAKRSSSLSPTPTTPKQIPKQRSVSSKHTAVSFPENGEFAPKDDADNGCRCGLSEVEDAHVGDEELNVGDEKRREIMLQLQQDQVLKNGYLLKQDRLKQWRKRWFVLRSNSLSYYPDDREYVLAQIIPRSTLYDVRGPDPCSNKARSSKRGYLKVVTTQRNYWLASDEPHEAQLWLDALRDWQAGKLQPLSPAELISPSAIAFKKQQQHTHHHYQHKGEPVDAQVGATRTQNVVL
ncbi:hypothetical protein H4219_003198 [Mycoemilia scoparia]|uniref:PH domain-containing protein n=1 Tax=Mycoemilia scoparia TaxID=417184 RepID=A0A9W8A0R4_9FUNG|nr:hypothetical protein H4219_003198 [Mycoemilia scoparia]